MPETQSLIAELDAALRRSSNSKQLEMLQSVTELFLNGAGSYSDEQNAIFDDVISRLIETAEPPALTELSARLAPVNNAPANVIGRLSSDDDIAVSGPVLEKSNALTDQVLTEIAKTKSQLHLVAIAGRARISESVTDVLINRGSSDVLHKVTCNRGARLSEFGFVKLINRAGNDKTLAAAIADRTDIPPELLPFLRLALG
jgi:uncharacterized protein (DUF2336 family)